MRSLLIILSLLLIALPATGQENQSAADLDELRAHGLSDLDLVDLNNMIAYYNYINRVVNGLGLDTVMVDATAASTESLHRAALECGHRFQRPRHCSAHLRG